MPASITLTVSHLPTSTSFFLSCLQPLDYVYRGRVNNTIGFGHPDSAPDFWITQSIPGVPPGPAHVAFPAASRGKVHDFFLVALQAGGKVHGEPALRDDCGYYSAAVIDIDGNSIEAVFRPDLVEANKENTEDANSVVSMTKSVARSKPATMVSSASKAKSMAPSKVGSVAPSAAAKSSISRAPSGVPSKAASMSPSQGARSVAPSANPRSATSQVPARTTISRAPTAPAAPQGNSNNFVDMLNEAKGTVAFAREMVNQTRPLISPTAAASGAASSPDSHGPSDAIVGTLLGVAAGAALHYAFSTHAKSNNEVASAPVTPPGNYAVARSESNPSWSEERYYYYHAQPQQQRALPSPSQASGNTQPYAIEGPPSDFSRSSRSSRSAGGQRLIEMVDNDPPLSAIAPSTVRPRRRSSFSGTSAARTMASRAKSGIKMLDGPTPPPTSYRAPTAITTPSESGKSRRSRASSTSRSISRPADEGYASATESRRGGGSKLSISRTASTHHSQKPRSRAASTSRGSVITAIKSPEQTPLPASRAASHIDKHHRHNDDDKDSFYSTHSKAAKTVIGRLTERQLSKLEDGGRLEKGQTDVTRSVIGKVKEVDKLDVSRKELGPEDSVSQVSSSRGSRRSRR